MAKPDNDKPAAKGGTPMRKRIGELLIEAGVISPRQLQDALARQERQGGKTVDTLIELGYMNEREFIRFLSAQPGTPSISLKNYAISDDVIALVPKEFAVKHEVFPIDKMGKLLTVGMVCPLDRQAIEELETLTGLRVKPILCTQQEVRQAILRYYEHSHAVFDDPFRRPR